MAMSGSQLIRLMLVSKNTTRFFSPKGREVADASLAQRNAMLHDEQSGIKAQMNEWLQSKGLKPEDVVYFQKDGALSTLAHLMTLRHCVLAK